MKELHGRRRLEYYLEYYGWRTVGLLAVLAVVIFLAVHFLGHRTIVSGVLIVNSDGEAYASEPSWFDDYLREMGHDPGREEITVDCRLHVSADFEDAATRTNMATIQNLFIVQAADVFLADEEFFAAMAQSGYLADLRGVLPQDVLERYRDALVYVTDGTSAGEFPVGVRVSNAVEWMAETGWYREGAVIGLAESRKSEDLSRGILMRAIGEIR